MRIAHQYKLLPTALQKSAINRWLTLLLHQYNRLLAERFSWYECNRSSFNACPLVCHLPELKEQPDFYSQKRSLVQLKAEKPWYKEIHSQVLQNCVERVKLAFDRFLKGDFNGKKSGKPRFKNQVRYRTFTFPQAKNDWLIGNQIKLPMIGKVKLILHRPVPEGFLFKTASITKKADGFYITISLEDKSVPSFSNRREPTWGNSIGIDLGLEKVISTSDGEFIEPPKFFRKSSEKLALLQNKAETRKKKSRARKLLFQKIARLHQKIARQRKQFHFETARDLLKQSDAIFVEDLDIKNMSKRNKAKTDEQGRFLPNKQAQKSGMNKSFADAGLGQFVEILMYKAEKAGAKVIKVNPKGTSQHCSNCLNRVPKELSDRWHSCSCGCELDRDTNAAILIKKVGLGIASLKKAHKPKGLEKPAA